MQYQTQQVTQSYHSLKRTLHVVETVITDNGSQFRFKTYEDIAKKWEFDHVTILPYYSQSNGKAEATMKIGKRIMKKVSKDHTDMYVAALAWRNTPTEGVLHSPAQKLHSRRTRTLLPTAPKLLLPEVATEVVEEETMRKRYIYIFLTI